MEIINVWINVTERRDWMTFQKSRMGVITNISFNWTLKLMKIIFIQNNVFIHFLNRYNRRRVNLKEEHKWSDCWRCSSSEGTVVFVTLQTVDVVADNNRSIDL